MLKRFKFTTALLKSLPANATDARSTELEFSDVEVIGLKLLSGKSGSKRFLFRYIFNGRKTSLGIGRFPDLALSDARKIARQCKSQIALGIDPKASRYDKSARTRMPTVHQFFHDVYLPVAQSRKRSWRDDKARFNLCKSIHLIPYDQLRAQDVLQIQLDLSSDSDDHLSYAPATCNRAIALLKTMGKLAENYLGVVNVALKVSLLPENNVRTRYCDIKETQRIISAALRYPCRSSGAYIALLFLSGCRATELRLRQWHEVDLKDGVLNIPRTKNGSSHTIYLSDYMIEIMSSIPRVKGNSYIFAGKRKGKPIYQPRYAFNQIKSQADIKNPDEVVFHTARHSVASNLISNGSDISSVQKLLNHRCIESTLRYAKLSVAKQRETTQSLSIMMKK
ncbi:integrase [Marinomonas sp. A3A]|uniref:site-specific integrase n=1 Tax=Marinomonas sp. A3A TaxID=2065312 RepID=UPI001BB31422|nr:site-specific integrase [Marinomonas sp. A3A]QUX92617.1 integrase [Marinomonas sp. A3A]